MKKILILLFLSYAYSDKLDLTYLPPPGSEYAGGRPEDIETPLEFPKETYPTTRRPTGIEHGQTIYNPDYEATIGINRIPPNPKDRQETRSGSKIPFNNHKNTFDVPTTTVSYAFTQTTTHPPSDFQTTINPITGLPTYNTFDTSSLVPGQAYQENINNQYHLSTPGSDQKFNQFESLRPLSEQRHPDVPDFQKTLSQYGYKQPTVSTTPSSHTKFTGAPLLSQTPDGQTYVNQYRPGQFLQGNQQINSETTPDFSSQTPFAPNQYSGNKTLIESYIRQPGLMSSSTTPHSSVSSSVPVLTYGGDINNQQELSTVRPGISQDDIENLQPNNYGPGTNIKPNENEYQHHQFDRTQPQKQFNQNQYPIDGGIPQQRYPIKDSSKPSPGFIDQQYPSNEFNSDDSRPQYPGFNKQGLIYNPERPQADSDRKAVILNYENVITPEGFAYSFDTSNGIHADESGTATDGVKTKGSFSYIGDDGKVYSIAYTADENGYQPRGDHLPTPPPIPEAIQRVIEKVQQEEEAGIIDDGTYDENKYGYKNYQDDEGRYPQNYDINSDNGASVHVENKYNYPSRQQLSPLRPSSTKYDGQPQSQSVNFGQFKNEPNIASNLRPIDLISNKDIKTGNKKDSQNKQPLTRIPPRRPLVEIDSNSSKQNSLEDYNRDNERKIPILASSLPENDRQHAMNSGFESDAGKQGVLIEGTSRRPLFVGNNYNDEVTETEDDNVGYQKNSNRDKGSFRRPVADYGEDASITRRPVDKLAPNRPSDQIFVDDDGFAKYNRNRLPTTKTPTNQESRLENIDYTSIGYEATSQTPLKTRTEGIKKPSSKITNVEQTISRRRRPNPPGLNIHENSKSRDYIDKTHDDDNDNKKYYDLDTTQDYETNDGYTFSSKPPQVFITENVAAQDRSQTADEDILHIGETDGSTRNRYGQRINTQSTFNPRTGIVKTNNTGYQYIPPSTKFEPVNELPGRVSTSKRPSQQTDFNENKEPTTKPFKTPNVSHVTYKNPAGEYHEDDFSNESGVPKQFQYQDKPNRVVSVDYDDESLIPSQGYNNKDISTTRPSSRPVSSTYSPGYQTTRRPHHNDEYSQTLDYEHNHNRFMKPSQLGERPYDDDDKKITRRPYDRVHYTTPTTPQRPGYNENAQKKAITPGQQNVYHTQSTTKPLYNIVSQTTPITSQGEGFEGTAQQDIVSPGQQNVYYTQSTSESGYKNISPTTPIPSQGPGFDGMYNPEGVNLGQYSTPFQTMEPVNLTRAGTMASRMPIAGPTKGPFVVVENGKYDYRLPSTTYRPNYNRVTEGETPTAKPGVIVDKYGNIIVPLEPNQQYPGFSPETTLDGNKNIGAPIRPAASLHTTAGYESSSEKVIGEDFSGPKQVQKFDPKTGYYY